MKVRIKSSERQSNSGWHRSGKPEWWARIGPGQFLPLPRGLRGDDRLNVVVEVPDGVTTVAIGVGRNDRDGVRETITVADCERVDA